MKVFSIFNTIDLEIYSYELNNLTYDINTHKFIISIQQASVSIDRKTEIIQYL